jgi:hypothetical protein
MKKEIDMKDKTKKRLALSGGIMLCVALFALIVLKTPNAEMSAPLPETPNAAQNEVSVPAATAGEDAAAPGIVVPALGVSNDTDLETSLSVEPYAESFERSIGPEAEKPESAVRGENHEKPDDPAYTDPSSPPAAAAEEKTGPGGGTSGGGLPGFGEIPYSGPNREIAADDMRENGNKIGIMD